MSTVTATSPAQREPELLGQTVVLIGGSAGIGLETARRARAEGAEVILTGRNAERLQRAAQDVGAHMTAAFDVNDAASVKRFFEDVPTPIDHSAEVSRGISDHVVVALEVARHAAGKIRPAGSLLLMGGTGGRRISRDLGIVSAATAVLCRHRCSAISSRRGASSSAALCRSGASSDRRTSPRSPCT